MSIAIGRSPHRRGALVAASAAAALVLGLGSAAAAKPAGNQVVAIDAREAQGATTVVIRGSATPTFTVYKLDRPARVVVDVAGARLAPTLQEGEDKAVWSPNTWAVSQVSAHTMSQSRGDVVRVVVSLARAGSYKVRARGNDVVVRVTPREQPASTAGAGDAQRELAAASRARAQAEAELEKARAEAERLRAEASARDEAASRRIAEAKRMMKDARERQAAAERTRTQAEELAAKAAKRERAAIAAREQADARRADAERADAEARAARQRAKTASAADAARLRREAEAAARAADERRRAAEAAAAVAQKRRAAAESAAKVAEKRQGAAATAVSRAVEERAAAEKRRAAAESARRTAEQRRAAAEAAAAKASSRAAELEKLAAAAERRAAAAKRLRAREEKALADAEAARRRAESERGAADEARAELAREIAKLSAAEEQARARRRAAKTAADRAAAAASKSDVDAAELSALRDEARRLAGVQRRAEAELAAQKELLAERRAESERLAARRDRAARELGELKRSAAEARAEREAEEKKLARLAAARTKAERELASARQARTKADAALAEATVERAASPSPSARVRDVDLVQHRGADRVVIALSAPAKPRVVVNRGTQAVLEIPDAGIEQDEERTLDTSSLPGPVRSIASYRDPKKPGVVRVVVDLDREITGVLKRVGTTYYWDFAAPASPARVAAKEAPMKQRRRTRAADYPTAAVAGYGSSSAPITQQTVSQLSRRSKTYRGKRIDLDYKDADIHNLMRLLADVGDVNIVVPDDIRAKVTIRLRRVPWDQALDVILASKGLGYKLEGPGLYRIATQKELDEELERRLARAKARAEAEAPEAEVFNLNYVKADQIRGQLTPLLSSKGRIEVEPRTNAVIINDLAANRRRIVDLLTRLDTQTPQIQIEARVVEARTSYSREFGIQWGGNLSASAAGGNATGLIFPSSIGFAGGASDGQTPTGGVTATPSDFAVNLPASVGTGSGGAIGLSLGSVGGNVNLNLRLSAAEDTGTVRIISAPKITTSNNVEATISSGVSIPISVISANGVNTQFVQADLALKVRPTVSLRDCAVSMEIEVTKNEADFVNTGARGDPSILTKEAKTTILVEDGDTTVIGGIYTRNTGRAYSKVPFLAEIPVFGWLFKNRAENDERSEVLVFITPKITNREALPCQ